MKKLALLISLLFSIGAHAEELSDFNQIKATALQGKRIRIVVDFALCLMEPQAHNSVNIGVFTPNELFITENNIAASLKHFTLNHPKFLGKPIYEFVRYSMTNDNDLKLTTQILNATDFSPLTEKFAMHCKVGKAAKIYESKS